MPHPRHQHAPDQHLPEATCTQEGPHSHEYRLGHLQHQSAPYASHLSPAREGLRKKDHVADTVAPSLEDSRKRQPFKRQDHASSDWNLMDVQYVWQQRSPSVHVQPTIPTISDSSQDGPPRQGSSSRQAPRQAASQRQKKEDPGGQHTAVKQRIFPAIAGREDQLVKAGRVHRQASYCWTCKTQPATRTPG